jgi:VanZ family protein
MALRNPARLRSFGIVATAIVLTVILYESSQVRGRAGVPELTTNEAYLGHFAMYAAIAFCAMLAVGKPSVLAFLAVLAGAIALGSAMELYQIHVPTRAASVQDAVADTAGALTGLAAFLLVSFLLEPSGSQSTKY